MASSRSLRGLAFAIVGLAATAQVAIAGSTMAKKDIVDTAVAAGDFQTLVTAVQEAGLVETLKGDDVDRIMRGEAFDKPTVADLLGKTSAGLC